MTESTSLKIIFRQTESRTSNQKLFLLPVIETARTQNRTITRLRAIIGQAVRFVKKAAPRQNSTHCRNYPLTSCSQKIFARHPPWIVLFPRQQYANIATMRIHLAVTLVLGALAWNCAAADTKMDYLALRDVFRAGNAARVDHYAARLKGHALEPFALYLQLQMRLNTAPPDEIHDFIARHGDSHLAEKLRADWLRVLGKNQEWKLFLAEYPQLNAPDAELSCFALQARHAEGDAQALMEAKALWLHSGRKLPPSCKPLFGNLVDREMLFASDVWIRLRLALEDGQITLAHSLALYLPPPSAFPASALSLAAENPAAYLDSPPLSLEDRAGRELALFALYRLARTQAQRAHNYWDALQARFNQNEREYCWGQLALQAARQHDPAAVEWFAKAGSAPLNELQLAWKTRAALREQNWREVLAAIDAMPESNRNLGVWRYWKARALKASGKTAQANAILAPLSLEHNYHGQLAAEELGLSIGIPSEPHKPEEAEIREVARIPAIQRALLLYEANVRTEANREWIWATKNFDDRQMLAAAELAKRHSWLDRSINTAERTTHLHNFDLRFPAPHRDVMQGHARRAGVEEAWVYGLIRQESRFVQQARSSVGASGLMQLMPATARWVAKKMGMRNFRHSLVNQLETNLALGTYYLKYVLDKLDGEPILATAAYNAGPRRAQRWRDDKPLEGAIYAETIPFTETRGYVQKVLSNATYYANRFDQRAYSLKERLGTVSSGGKKPECNGGDERAPACE
jgi:soluble lytic murein transglycosylase